MLLGWTHGMLEKVWALNLGPITSVGEAADGLRGQTMDFNAFDDIEDTPVLTSSSSLL